MLIHFRVAGQSRVVWFLTCARRVRHVMSFVKVHRLQTLTVLSLYRCWGLPVPVETLPYRGEGTHSLLQVPTPLPPLPAPPGAPSINRAQSWWFVSQGTATGALGESESLLPASTMDSLILLSTERRTTLYTCKSIRQWTAWEAQEDDDEILSSTVSL